MHVLCTQIVVEWSEWFFNIALKKLNRLLSNEYSIGSSSQRVRLVREIAQDLKAHLRFQSSNVAA